MGLNYVYSFVVPLSPDQKAELVFDNLTELKKGKMNTHMDKYNQCITSVGNLTLKYMHTNVYIKSIGC